MHSYKLPMNMCWQEYLSLLSESVKKKINMDKPPLFYKKVGACYNFVLLCEILMKFSFLE